MLIANYFCRGLLVYLIALTFAFIFVLYFRTISSNVHISTQRVNKSLQFQPYSHPILRAKPPKISNLNIALVIIVKDKKNEADYRIAYNSVRCYSEVQGYDFIEADYSKNETLQRVCPQPDFFFTRHCIMIQLMQTYSNDFFVFLDADIGVIHPWKRIEDFLPSSSSVNVIFYNRFYNDEIMAGSYIVRKSKQAEDFLQLWVDYFQRTKDMKFSGTDNGVIHSVVLEFFAPEYDEHRNVCEVTWKAGRSYAELFRYEACIQYLISTIPREQWAQKGFFLYDKAEGWSRDGWISGTKWCPRDLFFHGWKKAKLGGEWSLPFTDENIFDEKCRFGDYDRWKYNGKHGVSCLDVDLILQKKYAEKRAEYYQRLGELQEKKLFPVKAYEQFGLP